MTADRYLHLDVFTDRPFGGNQTGTAQKKIRIFARTRDQIDAVRIGGTSRFVAEGVLTLP